MSEPMPRDWRNQEDAMRSAGTWFVVLLAGCFVAPYAFGVRPKTTRQWVYPAVTIAFFAWVLPLMASLHSR
jgi:hypothetical protein